MKWFQKLSRTEDAFLYSSSLRIACIFIVIGLPFSINHLVNGRYTLAVFSFGVLAILALNAWSTIQFKRYHTDLILFGLVPAATILLLEAILIQGLLGVLWCFPAIVACFFMLPERRAWLASLFMSAILVPNFWLTFESELAIRMAVTLVMVASFTAIFIRVIYAQQEKLKQLAITDELTGLRNRRMLKEELTTTIEQFKRSEIPTSVLAIEIDNFNSINDNFGHEMGDGILRGVSNFLKQRCRKVDLLYRLDGERFLVVLFNAPEEKACLVAEQLRISIEKLYLVQGTNVTASFGIATLFSHDDWRTWTNRANERLNIAKKLGRNRIVATND